MNTKKKMDEYCRDYNYDITSINFLHNSNEFSLMLKNKWVSGQSYLSKKITINIDQNLNDNYGFVSLGNRLCSAAVYRFFIANNVCDSTILWHIRSIRAEERITFNGKYIWNEDSDTYCYDRYMNIVQLYKFINYFYYINIICKSKNNKLFWFTTDKKLLNVFQNKFLCRYYLNENNLCYNKKISTNQTPSLNFQKLMVDLWLQRCSS